MLLETARVSFSQAATEVLPYMKKTLLASGRQGMRALQQGSVALPLWTPAAPTFFFAAPSTGELNMGQRSALMSLSRFSAYGFRYSRSSACLNRPLLFTVALLLHR